MEVGGRRTRVIRPSKEQRTAAPVLVGCGTGDPDAGGMTVSPLVEDGRVEGFEVRCSCGERVVVECRYEESR